MSPLVSLALPLAGSPDEASALLASIRAQTLENWELLIVTASSSALAGRDPRIKLVPSQSPGAAAGWNRALTAATGRFIVFLEAHDLLEPTALAQLTATAETSLSGAAFGGYSFRAALGDLPADPLRDVGPEIGLTDLLRAKLLIPPAQILRRDTLAGLNFREDLTVGADYDLFLRLAARGTRWRRVAGPSTRAPRIAVRRLASLADHRTTLDQIWAHIRITESALPQRSPQDASPPIKEDLVRAYLTLTAFERIIRPDREHLLGSLVTFGSTFAEWWQRHAFYGPAPTHLLQPEPALDLAAPEHADLIAERLIETCDPTKPVVLLGLGRNARRVARILQSIGAPIMGRDDGLAEPPAWARQDVIDLRLIPASEPYDTSAHHLMTVLDDTAYLGRLPSGLRVSRWRDMPALLDREWRDAVAGNIASATGPWTPPQPRRGLFATSGIGRSSSAVMTAAGVHAEAA